MLNWPKEGAFSAEENPSWNHAGSNICLDFHGDPSRAKIVVFSDGNHHMALEEALNLFITQHPEVDHIFYTTTPPSPMVTLLKEGSLRLGNFILAVKPHLFISPPEILDKLVANGLMKEHTPFFQNRGNVLLIPKGNPKNITEFADCLRNDVRIFLSNPKTEGASYSAYAATIKGLADREGLDTRFLDEKESPKVIYGKNIHHREAPQSVADGTADVAIVYYHLALRYTRIFPNIFDFIALGGSKELPDPPPENLASQSNIGLIDRHHSWGLRLFDFLLSNPVREVYAHHGLLLRGDV